MKAAPANIAAVVTQVNKKKSIFTDKAQNLMIMLSRLPDAPTVLTAVTKLKMTTLNAEKLGTLINNWPTEDMNELMEEAKNFFTQEKGLSEVPSDYPQLLNTWEKPEAFFIFLGKERKFDTRLRLWKFKIDFEPKAALLKSQLNQLISAFSIIKDSKHIHGILSKILTIGNMMNAGDLKRGQADGFLLGDAFNKVNSLRDVDGMSILKHICKMMHEEDSDPEKGFVVTFKDNFNGLKDAKKC